MKPIRRDGPPPAAISLTPRVTAADNSSRECRRRVPSRITMDHLSEYHSENEETGAVNMPGGFAEWARSGHSVERGTPKTGV